MNIPSFPFCILGAATLAWACGAGTGGTATGRPAPSQSRTGNVITADELSRVAAAPLDEAVRAALRLRASARSDRGHEHHRALD